MTTNFGGVDVVPLLGAIVRCHCSVLWWGRVTTNFWRVDVVPCVSYLPSAFRATNFHPGTKENNNEFCVELFADVTLLSTLITQKIVFCYLGSMLV